MKAVMLNRIIFVVCLLAMAPSCAEEPNNEELSRSAYKISLTAFEKAKRDLEGAIDACDKNRKVIPPSLITPFGMDLTETQLALYVHNRRAENACEKGARERLFFSANKHIKVAEHYGLDAGEARDYAGDLLFLRNWEHLEFEAKYLKLDKKTRDGLEAISELQVPFHLFKTLDKLKESMVE